MKITKYVVGPRDPRPKVCRFCYAKITYEDIQSSKNGKFYIYRITQHKNNCRMSKRKGIGGKPIQKLKFRRYPEKELPVNPLNLMKLSPEKFCRRVNQYLEANR